MDLQTALDNLKNPNDKFDLDLIAIRVILLELLKRTEAKPVEKASEEAPIPEELKKGKRK